MSPGRMARAAAAALFLSACALPVHALDRAAVQRLAFGESDERLAAIGALVAEGDPRAAEVLRALAEGEMQTSGKAVLIVKGEQALDAFTLQDVPLPAEREDVVANNRLRGAIGDALAALKLLSPEASERAAAAKVLAGGADAGMRGLIEKAIAQEKEADIRATLEMVLAGMQLKGGSKEERLAAIRTLGGSGNPSSKTLLLEVANDADEEIRLAAQRSLRAIEGRLAWGERIGLASVVHTLDTLHASVPDGRYRVVPLLRAIAVDNGSFFAARG